MTWEEFLGDMEQRNTTIRQSMETGEYNVAIDPFEIPISNLGPLPKQLVERAMIVLIETRDLTTALETRLTKIAGELRRMPVAQASEGPKGDLVDSQL